VGRNTDEVLGRFHIGLEALSNDRSGPYLDATYKGIVSYSTIIK
jgi:hypothetical protein